MKDERQVHQKAGLKDQLVVGGCGVHTKKRWDFSEQAVGH